MIEELSIAGGLLRVTLDRYLRACSAIQKSYATGSESNIISHDFTTIIQDEVRSLLNYESKIQEAKAAIIWSRNSAALAPASVLPPEILSRIFQFVLSEDPCSPENTYGVIKCSNYPELLSHVCPRWRQAALGSPDLWTHIDICPYPTVNHRTIARAKTYAERSHPLLVYMHIVGDAHTFQPLEDPMTEAIQLITKLAARIKGLDLSINLIFIDFHRAVLEICFKNCAPGVLSRIAVYGAAGYNNYCKLMKPSDSTLVRHNRSDGQFLHLDVPEQRFENILFHCNTLCFDGIFAPWSSKAYQGLTELRLTRCKRQDGHIPESAFISILKTSPQLRVLLFGLHVVSPLPTTMFVEAIPLINLEILAVMIDNDTSIGQFFRWIAPGPKPLDILLEWTHGAGSDFTTFTKDQLEAFFARSNVGKLLVAGSYRDANVDDLSEMCSSVSELPPENSDLNWDELL